jgi:hypothetical protein
MPKRSNPFQRLVTLIHEQLGQACTVRESHMFTDSITGPLREVDIVVEGSVANHPIFLSIECRDHARIADVTWVETMATKHEHLPTSKLVLWSRSGFTKPALLKAKALKIETASQTNAASTDWARLARELKDGKLQFVTPSYTAFMDVDPPDGEPRRLDDVSSSAWYNGDRTLIGTIPALIQFIATDNKAGTALLDNTTVGEKDFHAVLIPPEPWFTDLPEGGLARIRRILISIQTFAENVPITTVSALNEGKVFTLAAAKLEAGTFEALIQESPDGKALFQTNLLPKKT